MAIINAEDDLMDKIVTLCKRRGFVFQSSEIYGGYNGFWDYGPYGIAMKMSSGLTPPSSATRKSGKHPDISTASATS